MAIAPTGKFVDELRPLPVPNDTTRPFYEAAKQGRLDIQRCARCGTRFLPPLPYCDICDSREMKWETVSGKGTIYTYTVIHNNTMPAFDGATPYAIVEVELPEQSGLVMTCNMAGTPLEQIRIGAPVEVTFIDIGDDTVIPDFKLAEGA